MFLTTIILVQIGLVVCKNKKGIKLIRMYAFWLCMNIDVIRIFLFAYKFTRQEHQEPAFQNGRETRRMFFLLDIQRN